MHLPVQSPLNKANILKSSARLLIEMIISTSGGGLAFLSLSLSLSADCSFMLAGRVIVIWVPSHIGKQHWLCCWGLPGSRLGVAPFFTQQSPPSPLVSKPTPPQNNKYSQNHFHSVLGFTQTIYLQLYLKHSWVPDQEDFGVLFFA